ncbi:MAG: hydrolase [Deltaproteobacteria bacterium RIFCSPLOWO2_12_FULL_43_16]|nr:MAG: hydrolase [Deltaproteobacteria bacterium GWA2_43_19]OGQ09545.1 MAG: hydrolase [Deltaproteobacteria bacterium RIFCSPHIGHO2_02_FULL_43_33]OGQ58557.1 MAG: hydrolase [Deltaproteobacteria bacterium RIFCSPLOWO2_12_FULL_43_16]HBR18292.1 amidohydrolase [Deltaproteobacteria bacterium]
MQVIKIKKEVLNILDGIKERLFSLSCDFYHNPETGLKEYKTSAACVNILREFGFKVDKGVAGLETAFKAVCGNGKPAIALLIEMDALPQIGHGCGHNISGIASIGAAIAVSKVIPKTGGSVVALGTPAEEIGVGKIAMIKAGVFEGFDAAMMAHPSSKRLVSRIFLGLIRLNLNFKGKPSHASAYPEEGINALDAVIQTFNSINAMRQQLRNDVRIHGIITDGGVAPNIIPEKASASFYVRAKDLDELYSVKERVLNCARGAALATGCELTIEEGADMNAPLKLNKALADIYRRQMEFLGLKEDDFPMDKNAGSSDIGNVSQVLPTIHPHILLRKGINIHTREFADATITEDGKNAIMEGAKCLALTAVELIIDKDALERVQRDFKGAA